MHRSHLIAAIAAYAKIAQSFAMNNEDIMVNSTHTGSSTYPLASMKATFEHNALWIKTQTIGVLNVSIYRNITLNPPATTVVTATWERGKPYKKPFLPYIKPEEARCHGYRDQYARPVRSAVFKKQTSIADGEMLTWSRCDADACYSTYTGPTEIDLTTTNTIVGGGPPRFDYPLYYCQQYCGMCYLMFPEVNVYYWPVDGADYSCLGNGTSPAKRRQIEEAEPSQRKSMTFQGLSKKSDEAVISSNGIEFVSPSVYIEFPMISAFDNCGDLGPVLTSVVRAYDPDQISTVLFESFYSGDILTESLNIKPFDFRYAECPPPEMAGGRYWEPVLSNDRLYNPIIRAPDDIKEMHPYWASCFEAPFQGNDPPKALTSRDALIPSPTSPGHNNPPSNAEPGQGAPTLPSPTALHPMPSPPRPGSPNSPDQQDVADPVIPAPEQGYSSPPESPGPENPSLENPGPENSSPSSLGPTSPSVPSPNEIALPPLLTLTVDGQPHTYRADSQHAFDIDGQMLSPGGFITVHGTPMSLFQGEVDSMPTAALIGTQTVPLAPVIEPSSTSAPQPATTGVLVLNEHTYTADEQGYFSVDGVTITPGGVATINGTEISLGTGAEPTVSVALGDATEGSEGGDVTTDDTGIADAIASGIGIVPQGDVQTIGVGGGCRTVASLWGVWGIYMGMVFALVW